MNMLSFMNKYGDAVYEKASAKMQPVFHSEKLDNSDMGNLEKLLKLQRKLFKAQSDCVLAISKAFYRRNRKSIFLVGEMGTGKTVMGASVALLNLKKNKRTIVVCPPHLVKKWAREIKIVEPKANIKILTQVSDI
jgi:SNF2 family DNA or RNA helicase